MKNQTAMVIYNNAATLKSLGGFDLAKAVVLNLRKIDDELIAVIKELVKDKDNPDELIDEVMKKDCDIKFLPVTEEMLPKDITVEQYNILINWM